MPTVVKPQAFEGLPVSGSNATIKSRLGAARPGESCAQLLGIFDGDVGERDAPQAAAPRRGLEFHRQRRGSAGPAGGQDPHTPHLREQHAPYSEHTKVRVDDSANPQLQLKRPKTPGTATMDGGSKRRQKRSKHGTIQKRNTPAATPLAQPSASPDPLRAARQNAAGVRFRGPNVWQARGIELDSGKPTGVQQLLPTPPVPLKRHPAPLIDTTNALEYTPPDLTLYPSFKVRKTRSWSRSWAKFSPFIAVFPQECMGQLASFGPTYM
jgi:hypothetical protein